MGSRTHGDYAYALKTTPIVSFHITLRYLLILKLYTKRNLIRTHRSYTAAIDKIDSIESNNIEIEDLQLLLAGHIWKILKEKY